MVLWEFDTGKAMKLDSYFRNRLKGLDLIDRVLDELWTEVHDIVQETGIKTLPMEKKCKKSKLAVYFQWCFLKSRK